ncbi:MAG: hypothetical protein ACRCYD_03765 [Plesiomonas sp.]
MIKSLYLPSLLQSLLTTLSHNSIEQNYSIAAVILSACLLTWLFSQIKGKP